MTCRVAVLFLAALPLLHTAGCTSLQTRSADFTEYRAAQRLRLEDLGRGSDKSVKRSTVLSDARTITEVNGLLRSVATDWSPVPWTAPFPQFTLLAIKDDKVTDVIWFVSPSGEKGESYVQTKLPDRGMHYRHISAKDFQRLLTLLGASDWPVTADTRKADGG
jgi:hypothetical protein